MRRYCIALLLLGFVASCGNDAHVRFATLIHYDDFPGSAVDLSKWSVDLTGNGSTGTASATVANGRATLDLTATSGDIQSSLVFPAGLVGSIGMIGTRTTLVSYGQGLPPSNVRFRLYTRSYKDNKYASGPPPDRFSDIFAQLRIRTGQFHAMVSRCTDSTCSTSENIFGPTVLGVATLGQSYDLLLTWNGGSIFHFDVKGVGSATFDASEGLYTRVGNSGVPRSKVEVIADTGTPTTGIATATVDYVDCGRWDADLC
jgi:hypothetical protein